MRCRALRVLVLFMAILGHNTLSAQEYNPSEPYSSEPKLKVRSDTALISRTEGPALTQQSDIRFNIPADLQFHLYTLHRMQLGQLTMMPGQNEDGITQTSPFFPTPLGLELSAQKGNFRLLYGSLSMNGLEARLTNVWGKAFSLPTSYTISNPQLQRSTSTVQKQDIAGYVTLYRGPQNILYSHIHIEDLGNLNTVFGFQIYQVDEWTLGLESLLSSRMLPETSADTWFSPNPLVPVRRHILSALSISWKGPAVRAAGDAALSWTEWEGLGWYYKGSFSFGPPTFRISGGVESIQGNFRDSSGEGAENNSRGRLELSSTNRNLGSLIVNTEAMYANNYNGYPYYPMHIASAFTVSKGRLFRAWWPIPSRLNLETAYRYNETGLYSGSIRVTFTEGGTKAGLEQTGSFSMRSASLLLQPGTASIQTLYALSIQGQLQFNHIMMQAETRWKKEYNDSFYGNAGFNLSYTQEALRISGSLDLPVYNTDSYKANISVTWQR